MLLSGHSSPPQQPLSLLQPYGSINQCSLIINIYCAFVLTQGRKRKQRFYSLFAPLPQQLHSNIYGQTNTVLSCPVCPLIDLFYLFIFFILSGTSFITGKSSGTSFITGKSSSIILPGTSLNTWKLSDLLSYLSSH